MDSKRDIIVRDLQINDVFAVVKILLKVVSQGKDELSGLIVSARKAKQKLQGQLKESDDTWKDHIKAQMAKAQQEFGLELFLVVLEKCMAGAEVETKEWLGSLIGVSGEEFGVMPPSTMIEIIDQCKKKADLGIFFKDVYSLFSKMKK
jgi:hypothetical protein